MGSYLGHTSVIPYAYLPYQFPGPQKTGDWKRQVADGGDVVELSYDEYAPNGEMIGKWKWLWMQGATDYWG